MVTQDTMYYKVQNQLKKKLKTDEEFQSDLQRIYFFYERKLMNLVKKSETGEHIISNFQDVVNSQFFQGYFIMKSILEDEETVLPDNVWSMRMGYARNEIPKFVDSIFESENVNWSHTDIGHKFGMDMLAYNENIYRLFTQVSKDIAAYGAYKAFVDDERYISDNQTDDATALLFGDAFDLQFINPQVYMQAQFTTKHHEIWDMHSWSTVTNNMWVGSVHYSVISPSDMEQPLYLLELKISTFVTEQERMDMVNYLIKLLPDNIKSFLQTRVYHVDDFDVVVPTK